MTSARDTRGWLAGGGFAPTAANAPSPASPSPDAWAKQVKTLWLRPGFYVFRYVHDGKGGSPVARIQGRVRGEAAAPSVLGPARDGVVTLARLGDMAVAHAEGEGGALELALSLPPGFPAKNFGLHIEKLGLKPSTGGAAERKEAEEAPRHESLVRLSGHVEGLGDTEAGADGWLGDPNGKARIEGFTIDWPDGEGDVDVAYSCTVKGMRAPLRALTGGFVGTQAQARPITGIWAQLIGERADDFALDVEAVFSARGTVAAGGGERLSGADPDDFLVALRVTVRQRDRDARTPPQQSGPAALNQGRVHTFASSSLKR